MMRRQKPSNTESPPWIFPRMRNEIRTSRFLDLDERLDHGVLVVGLGGNVLFANNAAARQFHCSPEDLVGRRWEFPLALGEISEIQLPQGEGSESTVAIRATYIHWDGGKPAYGVSMLRA